MKTARSFASTATSVKQARQFLLDQLPAGWGSHDDKDALALMLSELATNAVRHAATDFEVSVAVRPDGSSVRVAVRDRAPGYPIPQEPDTDALHGRGLHIVHALADEWGIDMRRDVMGKTVWFASRLAPADSDGVDEPAAWTRAEWPIPAVRRVLDALRDAVVATDEGGVIHYANHAAQEMLGWPPEALIGRSARELIPDSMRDSFTGDFERFMRTETDGLVGQQLPAVIKCADGSELHTDLVISVIVHPVAGRVVVGLLRARDDSKLERWSELTNELLEILADAPVDDPHAEQLLSTLGQRLGWDVTTLWALTAQRDLICRRVWTRSPDTAPTFAAEKAADPRMGSGGIPRWVMEHGQPLWVPDLRRDRRFVTDALAADGLQSAYAFPIRYRGECVGVVKMLSTSPRERDPSVVELMEAVGGHLGELLHASAQAAEREQLVGELLETRRRNEFLLLATQVLSQVSDYREMVDRLARISVPVLADLCLIDIVDEEGQIERMAARHADADKQSFAEELRFLYPPDPSGVHPIVQVMETGESMWSSHMDDDFLRATSRDDRHYGLLKALEFTSYITVPLRPSDGTIIGTVTLVSAGSGRRFSEKDLGLAEQLAGQVSSVVSRARAYDRERRISHQLQRNMLPDAIPSIDGWSVATRYLPASVGVEVGGDWYDVVTISDTLVALVVGDVEGHDLEAAKIMSRLRHRLGLLVLEEQAPGKALERLNLASLAGEESRLATALVGVLDTATGSASFSSAGHLSPVHIAAGQALELAVPPGPPLGVQRCQYKEHECDLRQGCLVMFTDGLVERRDMHLNDRLALLETSLRGAPSIEPEVLADHVISAMTADQRSADDIVVLTAKRRDTGLRPG